MNTKFFSTTTLVLAAFALSAACSPASPKLTAPPEVITPDDDNGGDFKIDFNPRVDILFVIDNSASMVDDQERLSKNIDRFVDAFAKNNLIDYHIGVVSVSDRIRQKPGSPNYYPPGQLRPLKTPGQPSVAKKNANCTSTDAIVGAQDPQPGFITRETPDGLGVLRESLKIGVQCLEDGGPEYEELFAPAAAALSPEMREGANKGFYREDAHLVVILVSDASPSNLEITPGELALDLRRLKDFNAGKVSTHAIGIHADYVCPVDPSLKGPDGSTLFPERVQQFVSETGGKLLSLCPVLKQKDANGRHKIDSIPWGDKLADIGKDIRRRTLGREIRLKSIPEFKSISVTYGSQTIPPDSAEKRGWRYNEKTNALIIDGDVALQPEPGAEINVRFTPVNLYNLRNGRAQRME